MLLESGEWRTGPEEWKLWPGVCLGPGSDLTWLGSDLSPQRTGGRTAAARRALRCCQKTSQVMWLISQAVPRGASPPLVYWAAMGSSDENGRDGGNGWLRARRVPGET